MLYFHIEQQVCSTRLTIEREFFSLAEAVEKARRIFKDRSQYTNAIYVYLWNTNTEQRQEAVTLLHDAGKTLELWGNIPIGYVIPENERTNKPQTL